MSRFALIILSVLLTVSLHAQEPQYLNMVKAEAMLQDLFVQLYSDSLSEVEPVLTTILDVMPNALSADGAMDFTWTGLNRIGVVSSDDGRIRFFTWHVMDDRDHYRYFGFVQVAMKKGKFKLYAMHDNGKSQRNVTRLEQSPDDWYGKLYYSILTNRYKRKTYYTLLGMDFNNTRSNLKTIEVLNIHRNQPRFLMGRFFDGRSKQDRVVLEYSARVAISVRFDPGLEMITFDHLVPFHPIYENNYEFYGPDGSFDGLEFEDGAWNLRTDIDARNIN
ncbi:MAG: hypothetical protein ABFS28_13715 [Bacteroidota bacterium]